MIKNALKVNRIKQHFEHWLLTGLRSSFNVGKTKTPYNELTYLFALQKRKTITD